MVVEGLLSKTGSYGRETLIVGRKPGDDEEVAIGTPREESVYFDKDLSWDLQLKELVRCIKDDLPITDSSSLDALRVMELIDTVYRQAHGKPPDRSATIARIRAPSPRTYRTHPASK